MEQLFYDPLTSSPPQSPAKKVEQVQEPPKKVEEEQEPEEVYLQNVSENISRQIQLIDDNFTPKIKRGDEEIQISVTNPIFKEDKITKHVIYTILGRDNSGPFETYRRYKDFIALRSSLVIRWPGCYIPQLPPKQRVGNKQPQFIEQRRKLLEYFMKRCVGLSYIKSSEEFRLFLRGAGEYKRIILEQRRPNYIEIAHSLQNEFTEFSLYQLSDEANRQIAEAEKLFQGGLETLEKFEDVCKLNVDYYASFDNELLGLMQGLKNINVFYQQNYNAREIKIPLRDSHINPYQILLDWVRCEILDMQAIIEAIEKKNEYDRIRESAESKLEEDKAQLEKLMSGKKTLSQRLSAKPKEHHISKQETIIQELEAEIKSILTINKIITARLIHKEIPAFKDTKLSLYEVIMRTFTTSTIEELQSLINQGKTIEESLNF
ncbi:unnamed protein product [Blepharisma stoltei]|uniref:PX domain-containing protein n=1 Tax=Blepharisma stoltei TaxID=1481888 RepID=A0AAU9JS25_9CILI|nr:unnamed protein product [Blepharisma stoltei]